MRKPKRSVKQAKALSPDDEVKVLERIKRTRYPTRNKLMFLLSMKAGLRVMEIAQLKWWMILEDETGKIRDMIDLPRYITKAETGGREIDISDQLASAIREHYEDSFSSLEHVVLESERGGQMHINYATRWFFYIYKGLGLRRCSSHSGRRSFITRMANEIIRSGGTLFDVMKMAGHSDIKTTQGYIEGNPLARKKAVNNI